MPRSADTWFALDQNHRPARLWRMVNATPDGPARIVSDLSDAREMAQGHALVTHASPTSPALNLPAAPADLGLTEDQGNLRLAALSQTQPHAWLSTAAVQIRGFLEVNKDWNGVLCIPGFTTTYWVLISANEVVSALGFATTSLVEALSPVPLSTPIETNALVDPLQDVLSKPEALGLRLAEARSRWASGGLTDEAALSHTWGAALGAELAAARAYWLGQNLALIAPSGLAAPYKVALTSQYVPFTETDEAQMTIKGFASAYASYNRIV